MDAPGACGSTRRWVTVMQLRPDSSGSTDSAERADSTDGTGGAPDLPPLSPPVSTPVSTLVSTPVRTEADAHVAADDMSAPEDEGLAEVRIIAADPDVAQRVALLLRAGFHCDEPRSYPAGPDGHGTLLHLTVDTTRGPDELPSASPWLISSRSQGSRAHTDEPG